MPNAAETAARRAAGVCLVCGGCLPLLNRIRCQRCTDIQRGQAARRRDSIKARIGTGGVLPEWKIKRIEKLNALAKQILQTQERA